MTSKLFPQAIGLGGANNTNFTISSNGSIQLAANNSTDIYIAANDNIGFGNTTPVDKLAVQGSLYTSSNTVTFGTAVYHLANGNMGVGNSTPNLKLEVNGNMSVVNFIEYSANITADYTITTNRNAITAGPVTLNTGVTVTVPVGSTWTIA